VSSSVADVPTGNTYDKYGSANPLVKRMMAGFFGALDAALPGERPAGVLEVGVGEGEVFERVRARFPDVPYAAVDLPDPALAADWRRRGLAGMFADIGRLPFPDDSFDLVLAIEVLEHVPDPSRALDELARVARSHLVLSVPREPIWRVANMARGKYIGALGNTPGHINHWSSSAFTRLVGSRFAVAEVHRPFPWTLISARAR
jgi:ubiquinone/menaquinone biosynthesis C-methylase UbiE